MNKNNEFELIMLFITLFFPFLKNIPSKLLTNKESINYYEIKLSQYTFWNIFIIIVNYILNLNNIYNYLLFKFILINSISICGTFHLLYLYDYKLIYIFPKTNNMSFLEFHTCSFITHILPPIYLLNQYINIENNGHYITMLYYENINLGVYTILFKTLWCFTMFNDFNISRVYISDNNNINNNNNLYLSIMCLKLSFFIHFIIGFICSQNNILKNNLII